MNIVIILKMFVISTAYFNMQQLSFNSLDSNLFMESIALYLSQTLNLAHI